MAEGKGPYSGVLAAIDDPALPVVEIGGSVRTDNKFDKESSTLIINIGEYTKPSDFDFYEIYLETLSDDGVSSERRLVDTSFAEGNIKITPALIADKIQNPHVGGIGAYGVYIKAVDRFGNKSDFTDRYYVENNLWGYNSNPGSKGLLKAPVPVEEDGGSITLISGDAEALAEGGKINVYRINGPNELGEGTKIGSIEDAEDASFTDSKTVSGQAYTYYFRYETPYGALDEESARTNATAK